MLFFEWGPEQEQSFKALKDALVNAPVMTFPDFSQPYYLTCDASGVSCSFNLGQITDGKERVIAYNARSFKKHKLNYFTSEKELLGILGGLQQYHEYLQPKKFFIRTDHKALEYLMTMKHCMGRLARWTLISLNYNFEIIHIKGKDNTVVDTLSRISVPESGPVSQPEEQLDEIIVRANVRNVLFVSNQTCVQNAFVIFRT